MRNTVRRLPVPIPYNDHCTGLSHADMVGVVSSQWLFRSGIAHRIERIVTREHQCAVLFQSPGADAHSHERQMVIKREKRFPSNYF